MLQILAFVCHKHNFLAFSSGLGTLFEYAGVNQMKLKLVTRSLKLFPQLENEPSPRQSEAFQSWCCFHKRKC